MKIKPFQISDITEFPDISTQVEIKCVNEFDCAICEKVYKSKSALKKHLLYHGDRKEICDQCGKAFFSKGDLWQHTKIHTGQDIVCEICAAVYMSKGALLLHKMSKHGATKKEKCDICNKEFVDKYHKDRHMKGAHSQIKSICGTCGDLFKDLEAHQKKCQNKQRGKSFACDKCPSIFLEKKYLREHRKYKHTETDRYVCMGCEHKFAHRKLFIERKKKCESLKS